MSPRSYLVLCALVLGCSVEPSIGTFVHTDGPRAPSPLERGAGPPPALVALTPGDEIVVVDPFSGAELGRSEPVEAVAFDLSAASFPHLGAARVAVRAQPDADEPGGDVFAHSIFEGGAVGPATHLGRVEGETFVMPTPFGVVIAQEDIGERWSLVPYEGGFTGGIACGRPLSVRAVSAGGGVAHYEALSLWPEGALSLLRVEVEPTGVTRCDPEPLVAPFEATSGARLVELGPGYTRAVADLAGGRLWVGALDGETIVSRVAFELGSTRLDSVVRMMRHEASVELVAVGADPGRVAWVEVALASGGELEIVALDVHSLAGDVAAAERAPSRSLAVSPPFAFVATTEGVEPFVADREEGLLEPRPALGSLRGPLAAVTLP